MYSSPRHQDALAHLLFGAGQGGGGGFVQLTGEVGTGKTTLCRCLLEQLPENTHVALILNPRQTALELLETICEELKISTRGAKGSAKRLVDKLNSFLLATHAHGENTLVIIDEAQNLEPEALEQVRLLTNLETDTHKLLQIILLGQPELRDLLRRPDLRQLAQRITARYHLEPLDRLETAAYVEHRLGVAGRSAPLFTHGALTRLFKESGGVPRLINVIAERALLAAYGKGRQRIGKAIVTSAARETRASSAVPTNRWGWAAAGAAAATAAMAGLFWWQSSMQGPPVGADEVNRTALIQTAVPEVIASEPEEPEVAPASAPEEALLALLSVWNENAQAAEPKCDRRLSDNLHCLRVSGNWNKIRALGLPVILEVPALGEGHVVLTGLGNDEVEVLVDNQRFVLQRQRLDSYWLGHYRCIWRMPNYVPRVLKAGDRGPAVVWVKGQLAKLDGFPVDPEDPFYGPTLETAVEMFQQLQGLNADGVVGPETLMALSALSADAPQLGSI